MVEVRCPYCGKIIKVVIAPGGEETAGPTTPVTPIERPKLVPKV